MMTSAAAPEPIELDWEATTNPYAAQVHGNRVMVLDRLRLESGVELLRVPVAYQTWGQLNADGTNVVVVSHALSGSADVADWWGALLGAGRPFDPQRFFVFCGNSLGSPYGSGSPLTASRETGRPLGPAFPLTTIRDDVRAHRRVLRRLGVRRIAFAVGGSMGGMLALEWALNDQSRYFPNKERVASDLKKNGSLSGISNPLDLHPNKVDPKDLQKDLHSDLPLNDKMDDPNDDPNLPIPVRCIAAIATTGRHSAWGIAWGEAQRQAIYADPKYRGGHYPLDDPPVAGLAAARMAALLTYRTRDSLVAKFGRSTAPLLAPPAHVPTNEVHHNEGNTFRLHPSGGKDANKPTDHRPFHPSIPEKTEFPVYSAQSYLRYQTDKFVKRFDANCYIAITRKLDTHDISAGRGMDYATTLKSITQKALIIGIESDGLFTVEDQYELGRHMPNAQVVIIKSGEGHDGFLLEVDQMRHHLSKFIRENAPEDIIFNDDDASETCNDLIAKKDSVARVAMVGESDDVLQW